MGLLDAPALALLSESAKKILSRRTGPPEALIRSELFGAQRFEEHGRSLAAAQIVAATSKTPGWSLWPRGNSFFPRVSQNIAALRESYDYVASASNSGQYVTPAAEWLLDNFHLVEAQLQQIRSSLPRQYYADLPKLTGEPLEGLPRVYGIAWAYVAHTDSVLDPLLFAAFLNAYQDIKQLNLGELWALPTTLRVVLLENLRRVADEIAEGKAARQVAHAVWDQASAPSLRQMDDLLQTMRTKGLDRIFLTQLWQRLPEQTRPSHAALPPWIAQHCPNGLALVAQGQTAQVASNLTISNIIGSLRLIGQLEWAALIEPLSRPLRVLAQLPSYLQEADGTRQQITQAMEKVARTSACSELAVAQAVLALGQAADQPPGPGGAPAEAVQSSAAYLSRVQSSAAYFLLAGGQAALLAKLAQQTGQACRASRVAEALRRLRLGLAQRTLALYLAALALLTWAVLGTFAHFLHGGQGYENQFGGPLQHWQAWLALALLALPASEVASALIARLVAESTRATALPRLKLASGLGPEHRTLVVIPCLLSSKASIAQLALRLRLHWLASRETCAQYALLSDWADAAAATAPEDSDLLANAVARIAELNAQFAASAGQAPRFVLLHRPRVWCATQERWIGWERKRGKLEALVKTLAEPDAASDVYAACGGWVAPGTCYILTLDSDTELPPSALRELVSIAAHPLNTPQIDAVSRRVVGGYAVLQPRVVTLLPEHAERTPFHALFAGQCGIDPYSSGTSEVYQDLFGLGTFTGKGLLNVKALHAVLDGRFPTEALLSHDLIEGTVARCAYVSDVVLAESYPNHSGVDESRQHRWTRGDWQLLPFMLRAKRFGIDRLGLWKMLDNLRRSLVAPMGLAALAWLVASNALLGSSGLAAGLAVVLAAFLAGPVLGAGVGLIPHRSGLALGHFFDVGLRELARALLGGLWQFGQLASKAGLLLSAIGLALWRLVISRKQLLQWTTADQAQAAARYELTAFVRSHGVATALCLLASAACAAQLLGANLGPALAHPAAGALLFALWASAPVAAWWVSQRPAPDGTQAKSQATAPDDRVYLTALARDTWRFFEQTVSQRDNYLPPDNLQIDQTPTLAHRTSPTNIGLYLLAIPCARQFGWISTAQLIDALQVTLASVERLEKHEGHLFNWYQTETLAVLLPRYVSSVDSGNLAGHLLAVTGACTALARHADTDAEEASALNAIALQAERLAMAMNFSKLYDAKRHLFHIGLRTEERTLDASYYDLLASESRLASFFAIAKGDAPQRHWMALGRSFLSVGVQPGLKSWSGSMFEYLMPSLVMHEPERGLLRTSGAAAVSEQRSYALAQGLPWGVSESAYFAQDHSLAYQYSPFGVARLALRRTPAKEHVVAPYACLLALSFDTPGVVANLRRLEQYQARGELGFMDAVDFTAARQSGPAFGPRSPDDLPQPNAKHFSVVKNYMAHHQGMALVSLCNALHGDVAQAWFGSVPLVRAYRSLLHERCPRQIINTEDPRELPLNGDGPWTDAVQSRWVNPLAVPGGYPANTVGEQPTQLLSNGSYSVALRANGAGASRWTFNNQAYAVSRWRDDALRDQYGTFFYLSSQPAGALADGPAYSLTAHPAPAPGWRYSTRFSADKVEFESHSKALQTSITVVVSPEDDTEVRTVVLHNTASTPVVYELTSAFEVALSDARADEAHPAFANLFVQTTWHPEWQALLLERRPRLKGDTPLLAGHCVMLADPTGAFLMQPAEDADSSVQILAVEPLTERGALLGRSRSRADPALQSSALHTSQPSGAPGYSLDPVAGLRVRLSLAPGAIARLAFVTSVASDRAELVSRIDRYLQPMHVDRAARMATTLAHVRLRDLGLRASETAALQDLTSALMYTYSQPRQAPATLDKRLLWRFGISGDKPIVLVRIYALEGIGLVQSMLRAQPWWSFGGLPVDVVVLNCEPSSYLSPLQREILSQRERLNQKVQHRYAPSVAGGFYLLQGEEVQDTEKHTLLALARIVFKADGRSLETLVAQLRSTGEVAAPTQSAPPAPAFNTPPRPALAAQSLGLPRGHFNPTSGGFEFTVSQHTRPARPWINVISNPNFGFQISESGSGYTWAGNSRLHQITPWSNDAVQDPAFEHYLLEDLATGQALALLPGAVSATSPSAEHDVTHAQGYTSFASRQGTLALEAVFFADTEDSVKVVAIALTNHGPAKRSLRAGAVLEWQLGASRTERATLACSYLPSARAVLATQSESRTGFAGGTAFLAVLGLPVALQWTCERGEFFARSGFSSGVSLPPNLGQKSGSGLDPCGALACNFEVAPGQTLRFAFAIGHADQLDAAQALALRWAGQDCGAALQRVKDFWDGLLGKIEVATPDPLFDALVNRWLLYQTQTSRLWAKAGFYQAGGASGFRDQLQDSLAFAVVAPQQLRSQILLNASRQFPEGDVQHWWHAPQGAGVRTHFSDDLLWLPFACAHYLQVTGDSDLLDASVPFLVGLPIPDGAEDIYSVPEISQETATVYEHCARAIDRSLAVGVHGLPLMGSGDWNDGMNRVGHGGRGESVWLAWFLCAVTEQFAPLAKARGAAQAERAERWLMARQGWITALHTEGWDGEWFKRAFFDNGAPLGSSANHECRIDLIAQAWSVLSGASTATFTDPAMKSMGEQLIEPRLGLLKLLTPPLAHSVNNPGYIQSYPPGVRENGGQYTHAGVWALMAQAQTGDVAAAWASFRALSPAHRSAHPLRGEVYQLEPYVVAGDVYSTAPYSGRGGWSWYTGAAAWLHRAALESLLGLVIRQGQVSLQPRVPPDWPSFTVTLRLGGPTVLLRWQAAGTPEPGDFKADVRVLPGQSFSLADLADTARQGPAPVRVWVQAAD